MSNTFSLLTLASLCLLLSCTKTDTAKTVGIVYENGQWYNGRDFETKTFYSVDGFFTADAPDSVITTYDLKNGYIIPPLGSAHNHNLDRKWQLGFLPQKYLDEGLFYEQALTSIANAVNELRPYYEKDSTVDVKWANQGLTSTLGHPFMAYEPAAMGIGFDFKVWEKKMDEIRVSRLEENNSYIFIDSLSQIAEKISVLMASKPDVAKVYLVDVDNQVSHFNNDQPGDHGLTREVARETVKQLKEKGFTVYAHIETRADFQLAYEIGVNCVAHMPGYDWKGLKENLDVYYIDDAMMREAIATGMKVIPTVEAAMNRTVKEDSTAKREFVKSFLNRYHSMGGSILLGSDKFNETLRPEIDAIVKLDVFSNSEILEIITKQTPQAVFPERKIGELRSGYEASFLVLRENPVTNIEGIKEIALAIKKGIKVSSTPF